MEHIDLRCPGDARCELKVKSDVSGLVDKMIQQTHLYERMLSECKGESSIIVMGPNVAIPKAFADGRAGRKIIAIETNPTRENLDHLDPAPDAALHIDAANFPCDAIQPADNLFGSTEILEKMMKELRISEETRLRLRHVFAERKFGAVLLLDGLEGFDAKTEALLETGRSVEKSVLDNTADRHVLVEYFLASHLIPGSGIYNVDTATHDKRTIRRRAEALEIAASSFTGAIEGIHRDPNTKHCRVEYLGMVPTTAIIGTSIAVRSVNMSMFKPRETNLTRTTTFAPFDSFDHLLELAKTGVYQFELEDLTKNEASLRERVKVKDRMHVRDFANVIHVLRRRDIRAERKARRK